MAGRTRHRHAGRADGGGRAHRGRPDPGPHPGALDLRGLGADHHHLEGPQRPRTLTRDASQEVCRPRAARAARAVRAARRRLGK
ncbi:hypothetical protein [Ornithinimicrobium kibberense]|uniref:hypothetical protein n=1 Tax=Ornithinimicrobium kibberense TaxID=282060 RepID=UPI0036191018